MSKLQRITREDITLGEALPWPLYDILGGVLLQSGQVISSQRHLDALLASGLYRGPDEEPPATLKPGCKPVASGQCFFDAVTAMPSRLASILEGIKKGHADSQSRIIRLARELQQLCDVDHDAALGIVHLFHHGIYPIYHLIHCAILCELISERVGYRQERRLPLLCATLTSNISIIDLQHRLHAQSEPLTNEQREQIKNHPRESVRILQKAGITGALWLQTVRQHHERMDGSGYGAQLKGDQIHLDARIMAIADVYAAMITARDYREGICPKDALRELFLNRGKSVDHTLSEIFIKELGVYPPGTFVMLNNGEQGIVTRRGQDHRQLQVSALLGPNGEHYANPILRDGKTTEYQVKKVSKNTLDCAINLKRVWQFK